MCGRLGLRWKYWYKKSKRGREARFLGEFFLRHILVDFKISFGSRSTLFIFDDEIGPERCTSALQYFMFSCTYLLLSVRCIIHSSVFFIFISSPSSVFLFVFFIVFLTLIPQSSFRIQSVTNTYSYWITHTATNFSTEKKRFFFQLLLLPFSYTPAWY